MADIKAFEDFIQDFKILGDFKTKQSDLEDSKRFLRSKGFHKDFSASSLKISLDPMRVKPPGQNRDLWFT